MSKLPYFNMNHTEKELIVKLILCTILSTLCAWAVGDPYSPTTAVTAYLFLYVDRGYFGGFRYAMRRISVQVVEGLLAVLVIIPCKYWLGLPLPDPLLIALSCIVALVLGLPINYKYPISPLNCTLANAAIILACSTANNLVTFPYRVLHCITGFLIGYAVNYIIMPQRDRFAAVLDGITVCTRLVLSTSERASYQERKSLLEKDLKFLIEDSEKGLKRHHCSDEAIQTATRFYQALAIVESYQAKYTRYADTIDVGIIQQINHVFCQCADYHTSLSASFQEKCPVPSMDAPLVPPTAHTPSETLLVACLIDYIYILEEISNSLSAYLVENGVMAESLTTPISLRFRPEPRRAP